MRIVIDMQGAQTESRFRGIGRYSLAFAQAVCRNRGWHEVILVMNDQFAETITPLKRAFKELLPEQNIKVWQSLGSTREAQADNKRRRELAELVREAFIASLQPDIVHITSLVEGYIDDAVTSIGVFGDKAPVSVTLYDLIPLLNPQKYLDGNPAYAQYYNRKIEYLKKSTSLLAISEFAREETLATLGLNPSRVFNVSTAIGEEFKPICVDQIAAAKLRRKFGLNRPFVLYTGGGDERKNLYRLVQAYAAMPTGIRESHQLLFAGKLPDENVALIQQHAKKYGLSSSDICFSGYVTDDELIKLYNLCALFVFPSWHEGFGLPALEAMSCGAVVIGANASSLPEVIGKQEAMFDPFDIESITQKLIQGIEDQLFRERLIEHGLSRANLFSWDETAKKAILAWEKSTSERSDAERKIDHDKPAPKPKLAFVSPMPPERTGIADYSAELIPALTAYYDVVVVVDQEQVSDTWVNRNLPIKDIAWFKANAGIVDRVIYQLGNSPYHQHMLELVKEIPGTVVLHDFYLSSLFEWMENRPNAGKPWTTALLKSHGYRAVMARYQDPAAAKELFPANFSLIQDALGLVVHSQYALQLADQWYGKDAASKLEVIPLIRTAPAPLSKAAAREALGFSEADFLICSFGFIDPTKLSHRLMECWIKTKLFNSASCHLIFVGDNHSGSYGAELADVIRKSGMEQRIKISGFVQKTEFQMYLAAADMAVQLRTSSRGETSAAVLDCMNHGLPVIVNANGSMADLDREAVCMLPDEFDDLQLVDAIEVLWSQPETRDRIGKKAARIVHTLHNPACIADKYAKAIERFEVDKASSRRSLIRAIAQTDLRKQSETELVKLARIITTNFPCEPSDRYLYLDITATYKSDLKTGIERVARAILMALISTPPPGFKIAPVYLSNASGEWQYRHATRFTLQLLGVPSDFLNDEIIEPVSGEIFLGLDMSGDLLPKAALAGVFDALRNIGVSMYQIVYDLLPLKMPQVFPEEVSPSYEKWLRTILTWDGALCISKSVADDLVFWRPKLLVDRSENGRPFLIDWFHLGADVSNSLPTVGLPENAETVLKEIKKRPTFLMVGTVEPRKGYAQTLEAFSQIWHDGLDVNLVIVGREGWIDLPSCSRRDIPETVATIRAHPELGKRLFWLQGVSDEYLEILYTTSTCLIAASYDEGFGLPLIEASHHNLPIVARDIPVFREVLGDSAYYFSADISDQLSQAVKNWITVYQSGEYAKSRRIVSLSWASSAAMLVSKIPRLVDRPSD